MIRTKDELMNTLKEIIGDRTDDGALAFIEDVSDTFDSFENSPDEAGEDWKSKYEENDAAWRERYRARFFDGGDKRDGTAPEGLPDEKTEEKETVIETFDDLFTEE